jgi:hypothetical protein
MKLNRRMESSVHQWTIPHANLGFLISDLPGEFNSFPFSLVKSLFLKIEEDYRKWRDFPCSWIGRINIVKNVYTPKSNLHV